jgi:signal transduction histidine kinase/YHS domain-containing protein
MARGEFQSLGQPIGGPSEVESAWRALEVLGTHIKHAHTGMHAYVAVLTTAQEAERGRLARELHDDTVQQLVALGQGIERAGRAVERDPAQAVERLHTLRADITALVNALRTVIGDLRPPALEELGLLSAVELLLAQHRDEPPEVTLVVQGAERRLDPHSELALFRIIQEAWNNIRRHAHAQRADFTFTYAPDGLHVTITDDGCGFVLPADGHAPRGRWGVLHMQERAGLVGGSLRIESQPGQGTCVRVVLPYPGVGGRDPVCGVVVGPDALSTEDDGALYRFCSTACRDLFLAQPERYGV